MRVIACLTLLVLASSGACTPSAVTGEKAPRAVFPELSGPYLGQTPPAHGSGAELFAPGVISTGLAELNSVFTPDGQEFYYAVDIGLDWVILVTRQHEGRWTEPEVASFSRGHSAVDLCISGDGQQLLYCSNRSRSGPGEPESDMDIWSVEREEDGSWSESMNLAAVNSSGHEFYPSLTSDGTLYLLSTRKGGVGGSDLYRSRLVDGEYAEPENLGPVVNSEANEGDAFVAFDESYVIFRSNGHERGPGGGMFISFRGADDSWSVPRNLGEVMNADRSDFCPMLTPDGRYFFFSSARPRLRGATGLISWAGLFEAQSRPENGSTDIYWIDAGFIEELRP